MRIVAAAVIGAALLLLGGSSNLHSQIRVDSAYGLVGKTLSLKFYHNQSSSFEAGEVIELAGHFKLTRPTVFFPQIFISGSGLRVIDSTLTRSTDSTWSFSLTLQAEREITEGDTLFCLSGEALAGSDSAADLLFTNLILSGEAIPNLTGTVVTRSIGPVRPYVRFALLDPGRPNPTTTGVTVTWGFRIDKRSEVIFKIYDVLGQEVMVEDLGILDQGVYINTFTPGITIPSGMFIVRLITNSGEATQVMHVVK